MAQDKLTNLTNEALHAESTLIDALDSVRAIQIHLAASNTRRASHTATISVELTRSAWARLDELSHKLEVMRVPRKRDRLRTIAKEASTT